MPGMDECGGTTRLCVKECPSKNTFIATGLLTSDEVRNEALGKVEYERPFQRYQLVPSWNFQRYDHLKTLGPKVASFSKGSPLEHFLTLRLTLFGKFPGYELD